MGLIKLLWDLYYFPRHCEHTPVPDDWPPDGSLHFIKCSKEAQMHISAPCIQYQFTSNVGEDDHRIGPLSMEIMKRFCGSGKVLTRVYSERDWPQK